MNPQDQAAPGPRSRRAPALPPEQRRDALIQAAIPLLRQHGRAVTTRQIADAAGVAEGTIFRVFPSKDALVDAVVDAVMDLSPTIASIRSVDLTDPLPARVAACARILSDQLGSVVTLMMALHRPGSRTGHHGDSGKPERDRHTHSARRPHRGPGFRDPADREALDACAAVFAPDAASLSCSPERAARMLRSLMFAGTHPMFASEDRLSPEDITDLLLHGIYRTGPTRGSATPTATPPSAPESGPAPC